MKMIASLKSQPTVVGNINTVVCNYRSTLLIIIAIEHYYFHHNIAIEMEHSCESTSNMDCTKMSLDEVFVSKSQTPIAGQDKLRLTPLSKKACLVHGIDPKALIQREYASFCSAGQDPEITTMKYEMYTRTRDKLYNIASEERQKLLAAKAKDDSFSSTNDSVYSKTYSMANSSLDRKEREISTLIENEKRRLEKVANRQQKELMRMLSFEQKSKEIMVRVPGLYYMLCMLQSYTSPLTP